MKAIYLDAFSGISGNMLLGAFLQAGVPEGYLRQELAKLPPGHKFQVPPVLFAKVAEEQVAEWTQAFGGTGEAS